MQWVWDASRKVWSNKMKAHIITRNTKADSSISLFVVKIFLENRAMRIIWLSKVKITG